MRMIELLNGEYVNPEKICGVMYHKHTDTTYVSFGLDHHLTYSGDQVKKIVKILECEQNHDETSVNPHPLATRYLKLTDRFYRKNEDTSNPYWLREFICSNMGFSQDFCNVLAHEFFRVMNGEDHRIYDLNAALGIEYEKFWKIIEENA